MRILIKNTFRNMFLKPFRTIIIILAIGICALGALLSFDFSGSVKSICRDLLSEGSGNIQLVVSGDIADSFPSVEDVGENDTLRYNYRYEYFFKPVKDEYSYIQTDSIYVVSTDVKLAHELEILPFDKAPSGDDKMFLSEKFAEEMGYKEGDTMILHDYDGEEHEFIVEKLLPKDECKGLFSMDSALITRDALIMLNGGEGRLITKRVEIHLKEDCDIEELAGNLNKKYPNYVVGAVGVNDSLDEVIDNIAKLIYIMFAIGILLTFFITNSLSEKIVSERMQLIGTYRSLGISPASTTGILLLENMIYALLGSVPSCVIYVLIRDVLLKWILSGLEADSASLKPLNPILIIGIIIGALVLECLCPIKEVIKAVKTPIRDIIFANKDTEYKSNKIMTVIGIVLFAASITIMPFLRNMVLGLISIICLTISLFLLYPCFSKIVCKLMSKLCGRMNKPLAMLAFREVYSKKSTVGSGVLISTAVALLMCVILIAYGLIAQTMVIPFSSDVEVTTTGEESYFSYFDRLEGVTEVEKVYSVVEEMAVEGEKSVLCNAYMIPNGGYKYYPSLVKRGTQIGNDEIIINFFMASKYKINEGDTIAIKFQPNGLFPIEKQLKVVGFMNDSGAMSEISSLALSEETYFSIFSKEPSMYLIQSDNPEETAEAINKYSYYYIDECKTYDEVMKDNKDESASFVKGLAGIVGVIVGIIFIGVVSNFLIGFDGRKRECAVMCSTAMSKGKLKQMLFLESLFASGIAILAGVVAGLLMAVPLRAAVTSLMLGLAIEIKWYIIATVAVIFWMLFTMTSFFVMRLIDKMQIAMQLKYE